MAMYIREVPCEICDTLEDDNSFCLNCKQKFCDNCKKGHLRTASTKHHKFAPIGDSLLPSSQKNEICSKHNEENQFYCKNCDKLACCVCLTELHRNHEFYLINQLVSSAQKEIIEKLEDKEKQINSIQEDLKRHEAAVEQCRKYSTDSSAFIKKTIKGWVDHFKSFEDELLEATQNTADEEAKKIERRAEELENKKATLNKEVQDVKVKLRTFTDASLLGQKSEILSEIDSIVVTKRTKIDPVLPAVKLLQSSKEQVRHILQSTGTDVSTEKCPEKAEESKPQVIASPRKQKSDKAKLQNKLKIITTFSSPYGSVHDIAPVSESKAWIGTVFEVMLVNTDGKIHLQQSHGNGILGTSVTSTSSGDALYVSSDTVINRMDQTGRVSTSVDLSPKKINCIRPSKLDSDVIVATDRDILILKQDGSLKITLNCTALALTEMSDGRLVVINTRGEVVLLDSSGAVTVLDRSVKLGWIRFRTALSCDSHDRIVIGNRTRNELHVYEVKGEKIELIKKFTVDAMRENGIFAVTVDKQDRMWMGTMGDGVIITDFYSP